MDFVVLALVFGSGLCVGGAAVRLSDLAHAGREKREFEAAMLRRKREAARELREAATARATIVPPAPPAPRFEEDDFYGGGEIERAESRGMWPAPVSTRHMG